MSINKIYTNSGTTRQVELNRSNTGKVKQNQSGAEQAGGVNQNAGAAKLELSPQGQQIQKTSAVFRQAMRSLNGIDDLRQDKLAQVKSRIEENYYDSPEFDKLLAEKVIPDEELNTLVQIRREVELRTNELKARDGAIDEEKLADIRVKVAQKYYDDPERVTEVADQLMDVLL